MASDWTDPMGHRRDDTPRGAAISGSDYLGREVERLAIAVARSNVRFLIGTTDLIGNLLINVNELVLGRVLGGFRLGDPFETPQNPERRFGAEPFQQGGASAGGIIEGISEVLTGAVRDSATLVTRSVEDFSRAYNEELESVWKPQPRRPGGQGVGSSSTR